MRQYGPGEGVISGHPSGWLLSVCTSGQYTRELSAHIVLISEYQGMTMEDGRGYLTSVVVAILLLVMLLLLLSTFLLVT
jgi:hypothetical protein